MAIEFEQCILDDLREEGILVELARVNLRKQADGLDRRVYRAPLGIAVCLGQFPYDLLDCGKSLS